jgi:tetratricopeptide (TPR) repeat protein
MKTSLRTSFLIFLSAFFSVLWSNALWAEDSKADIKRLPYSPEEFVETLKALGQEEAAAEFSRSIEFDRADNYAESIKILEKLSPQFPESPYIMWRLSRAYWVYAENLDIDDKETRLKNFETGLEWADKGLALNKDCAECYLFRFGNMGRISTTKGLMNSISSAKELSQTIAKSIALEPKHQDTYYNASLANAYYASGVFYRIIPDWFIIKWIAGVRGDKMKSLEHIKKAAELTPARIDYQVELGAIYLCLAEDKGMEEMREPGNAALRHAITMEQVMPTDPLDKEYAEGFLKDPSGACGFSRDGIVDLDKKKLEKRES